MNLQTALQLLTAADSYAAIEYLNAEDSATVVLESYLELLRQLYWEEKNLFGILAIGRAGIRYGLEAARLGEDDAQVAGLKRKTRALAFNLASYTWPGWGEAGIEPGASDLATGLEAALLNLRLVEELEEGALPLARANWMAGAQKLAAGASAPAGASFDASARFAREAGELGEALLAEGFSMLAGLQASPGEADLLDRLSELRPQLKAQEHGDEFIGQIDTAGTVLDL
jgi:hypothetical protein